MKVVEKRTRNLGDLVHSSTYRESVREADTLEVFSGTKPRVGNPVNACRW